MNMSDTFKKAIGTSSIFQYFKDHDKFLYHYTSAKTAIDYILKDKQLKLGRYVNTNDPKEAKTWQFSLGTNERRDLSKYSLDEISERFTQALKRRTNLACFSQDSTLTGDHTRDIYARGFGKSRMWAQYADNHKGVCLILEKSAIRKAVEDQFGNDRFRIYTGPVIYADRLITEVNKPARGFVIDVDYLEKLGFNEYVRARVKSHHLQQFAPYILAVVDTCAGIPEARHAAADLQQQLAQAGGECQGFSRALDRVLAGERDENVLCEGLDLNAAVILKAILQALSDPSALKDLLPDQEQE